MKRLLSGLAVLPFLAGVCMAGQAVPLSDKQMDTVTAGFDFAEADITNTSSTFVFIDEPPAGPCAGCYLHVGGTVYASGLSSFQVYSAFGP